MKFAKEGWPFVMPLAALAALLFALRLPGWGFAALVAGLLVLLFFRDPDRSCDGDEELVVAAADGLVTRVDEVESGEIGPGRHHRIVTFLSAFDVHVQKTPVAGEVVASRYTPGRKVAAFRPQAGEVNERHLTVIRRPNGDRVAVCQIAGLLARRVVCRLAEGDLVRRGQGMGLIKFGSRVDLIVPASYRVLVSKGSRLRNGATPVAVAGLDPVPPGTASAGTGSPATASPLQAGTP